MVLKKKSNLLGVQIFRAIIILPPDLLRAINFRSTAAANEQYFFPTANTKRIIICIILSVINSRRYAIAHAQVHCNVRPRFYTHDNIVVGNDIQTCTRRAVLLLTFYVSLTVNFYCFLPRNYTSYLPIETISNQHQLPVFFTADITLWFSKRRSLFPISWKKPKIYTDHCCDTICPDTAAEGRNNGCYR